MADPQKQAQQTMTPKKILQRCGERVDQARLSVASHVFGAQQVLVAPGVKADGLKVDALALHPAGLVVVLKSGVYAGKRLVVPMVHVEFAVVAEDEA